MNAKPALVRPLFASDLDAQAALLISRCCSSNAAAINQLNDGMYSEELRQLLGVAPREGQIPRRTLRPLLKVRAEELRNMQPRRKTILQRNADMLGKLIGLDTIQVEILSFVAMSQQHALLSEIVESIRTTSVDAIAELLSIVLVQSESDVLHALHADGLLLSTGIVSVERSNTGRGLVLLVPAGLTTALFSAADNIKMLMAAFLENAPSSSLDAESFDHLRKETALLTSYLSKVRNSGVRGVNILIYGPPGTGKTEYVRWLATRLRKRLYQVKAADEQGKPVSGIDRLTFFQFSQNFLQKSDALVLFDEIEDVFPGAESGFDKLFGSIRSTPGKMFINRLLESNPVPAIWISNEVSHIDKAYLRRFDFSFEMGIPPMSARRRILQRHLRNEAIPDDTIAYLSQQETLSPAQVEKAAKVIKLSCRKADERKDTLLFVVENSMALLEQPQCDHVLNLEECSYRLDYLNPDCDVKNLVNKLKRSPDATGALCFYGAPGTGKTALAHYLAQEIDLPLLVRRASDIISSYVGETEQRIAEMFKQAKQECSLLLLDEADSFLTDRKSARNSWEVTAVNEMLTQMERFEGLFICSTNLMQKLDEASLRRFALKIKFDYLKPEQRWRLFVEQAPHFRRTHETKYRTALNQLNNLTPGDFATVRRQSALFDRSLSADGLLEQLKQECMKKQSSTSRPIGFIHAQ